MFKLFLYWFRCLKVLLLVYFFMCITCIKIKVFNLKFNARVFLSKFVIRNSDLTHFSENCCICVQEYLNPFLLWLVGFDWYLSSIKMKNELQLKNNWKYWRPEVEVFKKFNSFCLQNFIGDRKMSLRFLARDVLHSFLPKLASTFDERMPTVEQHIFFMYINLFGQEEVH